jgi:G:T/U-mismatch repair DNA glycosylase
MLREIWEPDLKVLFVGMAVDEVSDKLGFYHLHPRDRFWELLEIGGFTPKRLITLSERKAMAEGQASGNLSDPVRVMFIEKKTSQLLKLGIGLSDLNRRVLASSDKDKAARPSEEDIEEFVRKAEALKPKTVGFLARPEAFIDVLGNRYPGATTMLGPQSFSIHGAEVWLLGSTTASLRGEALTKQEDAFFGLGERIAPSESE